MTDTSACRDDDLRTPCRFINVCHESRRRIQASAGLRGQECWAYQRLSLLPAPKPRDPLLEDDAA